MDRSLVSVIIVNWNGAQYLPACLTALRQQTHFRLEIVVIDNASTDDSWRVLTEFQAQYADLPLKLTRNAVNVGFCRGNNQGLREAQGEFVLLLNADVTLDERFIATLVQTMQRDPQIGSAVGKLLSGHDPTKIDSTGIIIHNTRRAEDRGQGEVDRGQYDVATDVFGGCGAACCYRRSMLNALQYAGVDGAPEYLDEMFFAYKEDVDLAWRAQLAGWRCAYAPTAVGWHFRNWGQGGRAAIPRWIRRHSFKNRYLMLLKNECWVTLWLHLPYLLGYEILSWAYVLGREPYLLTVLPDLFRRWPEIRRKRQQTQRQRIAAQTQIRFRQWFAS